MVNVAPITAALVVAIASLVAAVPIVGDEIIYGAIAIRSVADLTIS